MTVEELQTFRRDVRDALQQVRAHAWATCSHDGTLAWACRFAGCTWC